MALTPFQRAQIKRHLGYPLITATETLRSGVRPSGPDDLVFAIEPALDNIILECIEKQISTQRGDLGVVAVGSIQLSGGEGIGHVADAYRQWTQKLSDTLAIPMYRHSQYQREIGSFSGRVIEPC